MNEKEKYFAQIEARMAKFGQTLHEIKTRAAAGSEAEAYPEASLRLAMRKHEDAERKVQTLKQSDENTWERIRDDLENLTKDIDRDLRQALAHFR